MGLLESGSGKNGVITVVLASLFLVSIGFLTHNAFADSETATIPTNGAWGVATNPNTDMTYVANGYNGTYCSTCQSYKIQVINDTTNTVVATVTPASVPPGSNGCYSYTVAVNPKTNLIYTNNGACVYWPMSSVPSWIPQSVSVINGTNNKVTAVIKFSNDAKSSPPQPIAVNPSTGKVYALTNPGPASSSSNIAVINGTSYQVITNISVPDNEPSDIAINLQTNTIYVLGGSVIYVIDGKTDSIVTSFGWGKSSNEGIGVDPATNRIYVSNSDNTVSVIDGSTHQVITTVQTAAYGFVSINAATNKIYVGSLSSNTVTVINGDTNTASLVPVGSGPYGIGINANTNKIYVGNSGSSTVSVIDGSTASAPTVPSTPQNLQSNDDGYAPASISWTASSINGGSPITNYNIYRGTRSGSETLFATAGNVTSYTDNTANTVGMYFYKVTAVNSVGESPQSNEASWGCSTGCPNATVPYHPQNLAATAGNSQVSLSWSPPSNTGGFQVTAYNIYRGTTFGGEGSAPISTVSGSTLTYNDTGLTNGQTYFYKVTAVNSVGESVPSNEANATPATPSSSGTASGITLNNVQSTSGTTSSSNRIVLSNFNEGTGSNTLLLVGISANNNSPVYVTFNGAQLTQAVGSFYNNDAEFWYLKNPTGTGDVIVTMGGPTQAVVGAYSFSGVNQTASVATHVAKHNTTPNSPNISITTKYPNDLVLDLPSIYGGSTLGSPTCTQQWNVNVPNAITGASSSMTVPSPATVTCKWVASSADFWDDVAIELRAAG